jgi:uncharacterized damage-inducible protein DinB
MTTSLLQDAFDHHVWATIRVIDACLELTPEQLATTVPGTYGSIIETVQHTVGSDNWYLHVMRGEPRIDEDHMDLSELRAAMEANGTAWNAFLASGPDPDAVVVREHEDGSKTSAPLGIRLAQAVHHGTDHRSQVCTALTTLGLEPPAIDVWDHGERVGRTEEIPPPA